MSDENTNLEPKRRFHIVDIGASIAELETQLKSLISEYQVDTKCTVDSVFVQHPVIVEPTTGHATIGLDIKVELRRPILPPSRPKEIITE